MTTTSYTVSGMTCSHCVASVSEEVAEVPGVEDVQIDLGSGLMTVRSATPVDPALVRRAVEEAGYAVAP